MKTRLLHILCVASSALLLCQCSVVGPLLKPSKVIYALSSQTVQSPLVSELEPACDSLSFSRDRFLLSKHQRGALVKHIEGWNEAKQHLIIAGFAQRGFPAGYARSLAQRRAEAVRQLLIEEGMDAAVLHSVGYGNDQPALSSRDEVRVFLAK